jgi:DNA-binding beta-propeller fold protein YncE
MENLMLKTIALSLLLLATSLHAQIPDGLTGTLIVLNKRGDDASFIDLASGEILATLPTGKGPHELVVTDDGLWAIGTDYAGGNSLTVFDIKNLAVERTIDLSQHSRPHGILLLSNNRIVAVTSESNRTVILVDFINDKILHTIGTEQNGAHMVALSADDSTAFTANGASDSVSVIDIKEGRFLKTLDVPDSPEAITTNKAGTEIWVGSNDEGKVTVISAKDGSTIAQWSGFTWAYRILLTKDEKYAVVPDFRAHQLRFFDAQSKTELGALDIPSSGPQGLTLYKDDRALFLSLAAQNKVLVIDIETRKILGEYPAGSSPDGIGYSPIVIRDPMP